MRLKLEMTLGIISIPKSCLSADEAGWREIGAGNGKQYYPTFRQSCRKCKVVPLIDFLKSITGAGFTGKSGKYFEKFPFPVSRGRKDEEMEELFVGVRGVVHFRDNTIAIEFTARVPRCDVLRATLSLLKEAALKEEGEEILGYVYGLVDSDETEFRNFNLILPVHTRKEMEEEFRRIFG